MSTAFRILPKNYLADYGEFESWAEGTASAPSGWVKATSPHASSGQETTNIKYGVYSARVIGSTGAGVGGIYRTLPNGTDYQGRTFKLGVWAKSASTGPYIELNDGVTSKTIHADGLNAFVFLTTPAIKMSYTATQVRVNLFASQNSTCYFDGAVLCEGEDLFTDFEAVSNWAPTLNFKADQYEIAQREGSFVPDTILSARNLKLSGTVASSDPTSTRTAFDNLMRSLVSWKQDEKRHLYLYDDRVADVYLKGFDWSYKNNLRFIQYNASFVNPDAKTRSIGYYRDRTTISATVTEFSLPYNGNASSKPLIWFVADQGATITTCQLENLTTQENIVYTGTVPSGLVLTVDCGAGTVLNNAVNRIADFGTSDFMSLVNGTNNFRFSGQNCTIMIDYYERFL